MKYSKNPLRLTEKATKQHPNHKTVNGRSICCKECANQRLKESNKILPCPNCGLYTLHLSKNKISIELGAEIYCSACLVHWGITENW